MADNTHRTFNTSPTPQLSGDSLQQQNHHHAVPEGGSPAMNSREHSDMPPGPSYPSPNSAQMNQGGLPYYTNQRQLTADELHLSAELSRETSAQNMNDGTNNGLPHGQPMVLGSSNPAGPPDMGRPQSAEHQQGGQQQILQFTPNQQVGVDPNHDLSYGDQSARRKRSKVSRACDECRRKKIRCDATSETGVETCTNCRRSDLTCQFSRVPMKRGPSKGYIKELAERLNTLESQVNQNEIQYQPMNEGSPQAYQEFSPPIDGNMIGRKRTFSMSEGMSNAFMPQSGSQRASQPAVGAWPGHSTEDAYNSPSFANGSAKVAQPFWSQDAEAQGQVGGSAESNVAAGGSNAPVEIDEKALDMYYQRIQPLLPALPHSRDRLRAHLQQCTREIQEVFLHALYAVTGTDLSRVQGAFQDVKSVEKAHEIVYAALRQNPASRPVSSNLVWSQLLILMVLDADSRGPENLHGRSGIPKSVLIDMAFNVTHHIAKSLNQLKTSNPEDGDLDSDANIARRNWTVVGVLSRWHAVSVAGLDVFGTNDVATSEDRKAFGLVALQVARYSTVMAEVSELLLDAEDFARSQKGISRSIRRNMYGQLNRISDVERLQLEGDSGVNNVFLENLSPLIHWFITLLLKRHLFTHTPSEVLQSAEVLVEILHKQSFSATPFSSPFHLHAQALSAVTLLEITDIPDLSNNAWESLDKLSQIIERRDQYASSSGEFENIFATPGWNATIHQWIENKRANFRSNPPKQQGQNGTASNAVGNSGLPIVGPTEQRSLEHLADLAVGAGGAANASSPPPGSSGNAAGEDKEAGGGTTEGPTATSPKQQTRVTVDFTRLTKKGYLNVLAGLW
ncbi:Glucose-responsive transcription factor [Arachnomyces sp. PD_36]|nr:Glucose-responsive transcription factor [Arachnomyces sp. PD_36]